MIFLVFRGSSAWSNLPLIVDSYTDALAREALVRAFRRPLPGRN